MSSLSSRIAAMQEDSEKWRRKVGNNNEKDKVPTLSTLKCQLESSQTTWKQRVTSKDTEALTVQGKLKRDNIQTLREDKDKDNNDKKGLPDAMEMETSSDSNSSDDDSEEEPSQKYFNPMDQQFQSFFSTKKEAVTVTNADVVTVVDLNDITSEEKIKPLLSSFNKPKKPGNSNAALLRKKKVATSIESTVNDALSQKIDYLAEVKLKKVEIKEKAAPLLLKIKGKKLAVPVATPFNLKSLNNGDCFVLLKEEKVYCFYGDYCNLIERAKCDEFWYLLTDRKKSKKRKCCKVKYLGENWGKFCGEFETERGHGQGDGPSSAFTLKEDELGDESDAKWEESLGVMIWGWDGFAWGELSKKGCGWGWEHFEEELRKHGHIIIQITFGKKPLELYSYKATTPSSKKPMPLPLQTNLESMETFFNPEKYIHYKLIKENLEPIEFYLKFSGFFKEKKKVETIFNRNLKDLKGNDDDGENDYFVDFNEDHVEDFRGEFVVENFVKFYGNERVEVMEEDPRTVTYETLELQKYLVTPTEIHSISEEDQANFTTFHSSHSYILLWSFTLTYTTHKLYTLEISKTTRSKTHTVFILWHGNSSPPLAKAKMSSIFSVNEEFLKHFDEKYLNAEKVAMEENQEIIIFTELFKSPIKFSKLESGGWFKIFRNLRGDFYYREIEKFYDDCSYVNFDEGKIAIGNSYNDKAGFEKAFDDFEKVSDTIRFEKGIKIEKVWQLKLWKSYTVRVFNILNFQDYFYEENGTYLIFGEKETVLILNFDNYDVRRAVVLGMKDFKNTADIVVQVDDEKYELETLQTFLKNVKQDKIKEKHEFQTFSRFYSLDKIGPFLSDEVIVEKLSTTPETFHTLPKWRQRKELLNIDINWFI